MMARRCARTLVMLAGWLGMTVSANAGAILIDDFSLPVLGHGASTTSAVGSSATDVDLAAGVIGGIRELWARKVSGNTGNTGFIVEALAGGGVGLFNQAGPVQGRGLVRYDGVADSPVTAANATPGTNFSVGFGNTDLTGGGTNDAFDFRDWAVSSSGTNGPAMIITLQTATGNLTYQEFTIPQAVDHHYVLFTAFSGPGDITKVNGIEVFFDGTASFGSNSGPPDADVFYGSMWAAASVPEPGTLALTLTAVIALGFFARKRSR